MDMSPKGMKDRFKGRYSPEVGGSRSWDEGQPKGFQGCDLAEAKGSTSIQTDCKLSQGRVASPGRTSASAGSSVDLGFPMTGSPGLSHPGGMGPKSQKKSGSGMMKQMGRTGGQDMSPKAMKERFKGRSHGM